MLCTAEPFIQRYRGPRPSAKWPATSTIRPTPMPCGSQYPLPKRSGIFHEQRADLFPAAFIVLSKSWGSRFHKIVQKHDFKVIIRPATIPEGNGGISLRTTLPIRDIRQARSLPPKHCAGMRCDCARPRCARSGQKIAISSTRIILVVHCVPRHSA